MKKIIIIFSVIFAGCATRNTQNDIEVEILTKELNCKKLILGEYSKYMKMDTIAVEESRTLLTYKVTNNSDKTFYFNFDANDNKFKDQYININQALVSILDKNGNNIKPHLSSPSAGLYSEKALYLEYLGYDLRGLSHDNNRNFVLPAHETVYFEWFIVLPFGNLLEETNYSVVLDSNQKYLAEVLIHSDTTNYKKTISRTDLKTIQENGYEVFNGTIKSKNKIPIVFKQ